jgi:SAM-dependent methyltransferase
MNQEQTSVPFENFAQYYDQFMLRLVNYPAWVDYIIKIFKEHNLYPKTILDLACGTGIPSLLFAKRGYRVIGVDNSEPMLEVFKQKIAQTKYDIHSAPFNKVTYDRLKIQKSDHTQLDKRCGVKTIQSDIRNFSPPEKVDAAVSLYDSINYLLNEDDLKSCFQCVYHSLNSNGIFTFDMNTIFCLESFWNNHETPRRIGGIYSIWRNSYDPKKRISTLFLTIYTDDGRTFQEIHKERAYSEDELKAALQSAGFTDIKFYAHLTLLPPIDTTQRIMVVARKPDKPRTY